MTLATCLIALFATLVAAIVDAREGRIPNWLTLPLLLSGPLSSVASEGLAGLLFSALGMISCAIVPLLLFVRDAMGGGDVKMFAALGGLFGMTLGFEVQFFSFCFGCLLFVGQLAWNGRLWRVLNRALVAAGQRLVPTRHRRSLEPATLTYVRMGGSIFLATLATVAMRGPF